MKLLRKPQCNYSIFAFFLKRTPLFPIPYFHLNHHPGGILEGICHQEHSVVMPCWRHIISSPLLQPNLLQFITVPFDAVIFLYWYFRDFLHLKSTNILKYILYIYLFTDDLQSKRVLKKAQSKFLIPRIKTCKDKFHPSKIPYRK